jgi:hypothetical protein
MKRNLLTGSLALCISACVPAPQEAPPVEPVATAEATSPSAPAPQGALSQNYMDAAQALYGDDLEKAKTHLAAFAAESTGEVQTLAKAAAEAKDLAAMRQTFRDLSELTARMELPAEYAVAYCPMFKSGARAHWVQKKGTLANPYFGKANAMASCGTFVN